MGADAQIPGSVACRRYCARYAFACGALAHVVGLVALAGWWLDATTMARVRPDWPPLVPNAALMSAAAGIALLLCAARATSRAARSLMTACAALVTLVAALTLAEYLLGVDLGIDQLLATTEEALRPPYSGRPSPQSAAVFLLLGAALLAVDVRRRGAAVGAQLAALAAASFGAIVLVSFMFGAAARHEVRALLPYAGMAPHVALVALLVGTGIVAARPDVGVTAVVARDDAGGMAARRLLAGLLAMAPLAAVIAVGARAGWYTLPVAAALVVFAIFLDGGAVILFTSSRLSLLDAEARRGAERLRQSQEQTRALVELAPDGIFIADIEGRYTDVNGAGCRLLGRSRDDIVGKTILDLIPPDDVERLWQTRERLLAGEVDVGEWRLLHADGTYLPVEVSANILPDGRWQGFARDLREKRRAENELRDAHDDERRLRAELEELSRAGAAVAEAVADLPASDLPSVLHVIAEQAQALTHAQYAALGIGTDPEAPFDPWVVVGIEPEVADAIGGPPRPRGTLGAVARGGRVVRVREVREHEAFVGLPRGHPEVTSLLGVPITRRGHSLGNIYLANKQGAAEFSAQDERLVAMLATPVAAAVEIARAHEGERQQRAWLHSVIAQMPEPVVLVDESGKIALTNEAARTLSAGELVEGNLPALDVRNVDGSPIGLDDLPVVRALRRGEVTVRRALQMRLSDGRRVPLVASAAPVRGADGRISGACVVFQDVSAQQELEQLREEWISIVAHDLRQPVTTIALTSDGLSRRHEGELSERERRAFERIRTSARMLRRMIDDLLDASRIEAKRLTIEPRATDVRALIASVVEGLTDVTASYGVSIRAAGEQSAWIDPERIRQVLTNLITNAAKYGTPGTVIEIEAAARDDVVEVSVTNEGPGIVEEELERVFERFTRARAARMGKAPGVGLGLYIARGLVEAHGGRIWAESARGATTTFHFTVPRAPRVPRPEGAPEPRASI